MEPTTLFLFTMAVCCGLGASALVVFVVFALFEYVGEYLSVVKEALRRYACRDMVVTEYYDDLSATRVRRYERPTPDRVEIARKAKNVGGKR